MYLFQDNPLSSADGRSALATPGNARVAASPRRLFTPEEEHVLHIASRDGVRSIGQAGRFGKALDRFFAIRRPLPLASPRLEGLRRVAILLRMKRPMPATELDRWHALGFSDQQFELLEALIAPSRKRRASGAR